MAIGGGDAVVGLGKGGEQKEKVFGRGGQPN